MNTQTGTHKPLFAGRSLRVDFDDLSAHNVYSENGQSIRYAIVSGPYAGATLTRLREEGVIKAWGLGVNRVEPCEMALRWCFDGHSLASYRDRPDAAICKLDAMTASDWS